MNDIKKTTLLTFCILLFSNGHFFTTFAINSSNTPIEAGIEVHTYAESPNFEFGSKKYDYWYNIEWLNLIEYEDYDNSSDFEIGDKRITEYSIANLDFNQIILNNPEEGIKQQIIYSSILFVQNASTQFNITISIYDQEEKSDRIGKFIISTKNWANTTEYTRIYLEFFLQTNKTNDQRASSGCDFRENYFYANRTHYINGRILSFNMTMVHPSSEQNNFKYSSKGGGSHNDGLSHDAIFEFKADNETVILETELTFAIFDLGKAPLLPFPVISSLFALSVVFGIYRIVVRNKIRNY